MTKGRGARDVSDRWRTAVERVRREAKAGTISADATAAIQEVFPGIEFGTPVDDPSKSGFGSPRGTLLRLTQATSLISSGCQATSRLRSARSTTWRSWSERPDISVRNDGIYTSSSQQRAGGAICFPPRRAGSRTASSPRLTVSPISGWMVAPATSCAGGVKTDGLITSRTDGPLQSTVSSGERAVAE